MPWVPCNYKQWISVPAYLVQGTRMAAESKQRVLFSIHKLCYWAYQPQKYQPLKVFSN